ncbi:MAG: radical SAM family heme chaperone HemW [Pseudomonadota bacterium]
MIAGILQPPASGLQPGLYVHVPFCLTRCRYCAFASSTELSGRGAFLDALALGVRRHVGRWGAFDSVYVGGGTPTVLGLDGLARLVAALGPLAITPGADRTLEANPDDCTSSLLAGARALGFTRLSLGLQALDDVALRWMGRRHDAATGMAAARAARAAGFEDVSFDLIYGRPGQTPDAWRRELDAALALGPTHLSCYELSVEPETPLARDPDARPDEDARADLFFAGSEHLTAAGFEHYEVSSFARPGHRSRHNLKYWTHVPYLGLGPGAHSFDGRQRWWNPRDLTPWATALARREDPAEGREILDAASLRLERLALGFRHTGGVAFADLGGCERELAAAMEAGLLERAGDRVVPSVAGLLQADGLAVRCA